MSRTASKILAGAKEALAVARGERLPAKATLFGWAVWHPSCGLTMNICGDRDAAWQEAANMVGNSRRGTRSKDLAKKEGFRVVRVRIETVRSPRGSAT